MEQIDWHATGLLVAVLAAGLLGLWIVWRVVRWVVKTLLVLALLGGIAAAVFWWVRTHP